MHCRLNAILSSKLLHYIEENSLTPTNDIKDADFILFNTCGFDKKHELVSEKIINELIANAKEGARIVTVGCLTKTNRQFLEEKFTNIEIVGELEKLDKILNATKPILTIQREIFYSGAIKHITNRENNFPISHRIVLSLAKFILNFSNRFKYPFANRIGLQEIIDEHFHRNKLYVQIGSGCNGNCSYCVIKKAKGAPNSRQIEHILEDIRVGLSEKYHDKEGVIVDLIADDCASYGADIGSNLVELLEAINEKFPSVPIHLYYINPLWIEQDRSRFIDIFKRFNVSCVNISIQSGSERILKLMNRKYKILNIVSVINELKIVSPETTIWSHFLVGFPTENWVDFGRTLLVARHFSAFAVFRYTEHEAARSAELPHDVGPIKSFLRSKIMFLFVSLRGLRKFLFYF